VSHVFEFDSFEEAQEKMASAEAKANAAVTTRQKEIAYGTHWLRGIDGAHFFEYGYVLPQDNAEANQTKESIRALRDAYARGYRFSQAFSLYTPTGELGDTHIAVIWPITEDEFNSASACQWQLTGAEWEREMLSRIVRELADAQQTTDPASPTPQEGP